MDLTLAEIAAALGGEALPLRLVELQRENAALRAQRQEQAKRDGEASNDC